MNLKFEMIVNGTFQENCFLVWNEETKAGVFIDPGDEADRLIRTAEFLGVKVEGIFNTHGHIDHAGAVARVKELCGAPFAIHPDDRFLLESMPEQANMFGLPKMEVPEIDRELHHGDKLDLVGHQCEVIHSPGHSPGSVCFLFEGIVFAGDTLFAGSIGRGDLPGGSHTQLINSITERLLVLDDNVKVNCGHGPATTIGVERKHNPFLTGVF